jgi:hypothetical protein
MMAENDGGSPQSEEFRVRLSTNCTAKVTFFGAEPTQLEMKRLIDVLNTLMPGLAPVSGPPGADLFEAHRI